MVADGADLLDVGGESTRPGPRLGRRGRGDRRGSCRSSRAIRAALPDVPISIDTTKPERRRGSPRRRRGPAQRRLGRGPATALARLAAERGVPDRRDAQPRRGALRRPAWRRWSPTCARRSTAPWPAGVAWERPDRRPGLRVRQDAPTTTWRCCATSPRCTSLGRPSCSARRRKSTLGKVLDLPADQRLEATLATTALGIAAGADIVRVHDVQPNVRAARMADAIVRGWRPADGRRRDA